MVWFILSGRRCALFVIIQAGTIIALYCIMGYTDDSYMMFVHKADQSALSHSLVHQHQYKFLLNNKSICDNSIYLIFCISSDPQHGSTRKVIRETWGSIKEYNGAKIRLVFLLGVRKRTTPALTKSLQKAINSESGKYQDIVQADFVDSYKNLTIKNVLGLHWVHKFCNQSHFIVKTDDDVFINVFKLVRFLQMLQSSSSHLTNFLYCKVNRRIQARRSNDFKWYLSPEEYDYDLFPPYCNGVGYILSADVAAQLYSVTKHVPFLSIEDVYIGFCAKYSGITPTESRLGFEIDFRYERKEENFVALLDWSIFINAGTNETRLRNAWTHLLTSSSHLNSIYYYKMIQLSRYFCAGFIVFSIIIFVLSRLKSSYSKWTSRWAWVRMNIK